VSGNAPREPLASWDFTAACWLDASGMSSDLFGQSEPFSGRWPTSGMTRSGRSYPLPMSGHRIAASGFSSSPGLLPTPQTEYDGRSQEAWEAAKRKAAERHQAGEYAKGTGAPGMMDLQRAVHLLPTPTAHDDGKSPEAHMAMKAQMPGGERKTITSLSVLARNEMRQADALLKTPTAQLAVNGGSQHPDKRREGGHGPTLADQVEHELLPTPRATDGTKWGPGQTSTGGPALPSAVTGLLPTPRASDTGTPGRRASDGFRPPLSQVLLPTPLSADGGLNRGSSAGYGLRNVSREIARGDRLLPTPMAADGDRQSLTMPRGNPTLAGALLPTPRCADGMVASNMQSNRDRLEGGARRRGTLEEEISLMPGESDGDLTARQSPGGKPSSDGQHQGQLSLDGLEKDFLPDS